MRPRAQDAECVGIEHRRADARDHVGAERLLPVQDRAHRERLAGLEIEQRRDHSRRSEIERERVPTFVTVREWAPHAETV